MCEHQEQLDRIERKVDDLQNINIKNGGGRHVMFKRDEFFQMLYDRPKETFNNVADFSTKAKNIIDFGFKAVVMIGAIYLMFIQ